MRSRSRISQKSNRLEKLWWHRTTDDKVLLFPLPEESNANAFGMKKQTVIACSLGKLTVLGKVPIGGVPDDG